MAKERMIDVITKYMNERLNKIELYEETSGDGLYEDRKEAICKAKVNVDYISNWEKELSKNSNWVVYSEDSDLSEFKRRFANGEFLDQGFDDLPDRNKPMLIVVSNIILNKFIRLG